MQSRFLHRPDFPEYYATLIELLNDGIDTIAREAQILNHRPADHAAVRRRLGGNLMTYTLLIIRIFAMSVALAGCSNDILHGATNQSETQLSGATKGNFRPINNLTRVFVFPVYSSSDNRVYFGTGAHNASREARQRPSYKLNVDGHPVATFPDNQFIELDLQPGKYSLEVEELGWLDTSLKKATAPVSIGGPGQVVFIAIPTSASDMALRVVDSHYGMESVADREKAGTNQN
jgi:hypothetical protein